MKIAVTDFSGNTLHKSGATQVQLYKLTRSNPDNGHARESSVTLGRRRMPDGRVRHVLLLAGGITLGEANTANGVTHYEVIVPDED